MGKVNKTEGSELRRYAKKKRVRRKVLYFKLTGRRKAFFPHCWFFRVSYSGRKDIFRSHISLQCNRKGKKMEKKNAVGCGMTRSMTVYNSIMFKFPDSSLFSKIHPSGISIRCPSLATTMTVPRRVTFLPKYTSPVTVK